MSLPVWLSAYVMHLVCEGMSNEAVVMPDDSFHYEVVRRYLCFSWHCISVNLLDPSLTVMYTDRSVEGLFVEVVVTDGVE